MTTPFARFILSETGRQTFGVLGLTASFAAFLGSSLPHTYLLYKYKEIVQFYEDAMPIDLNPEVADRANKVLEATTLSPSRKANVRFFPVAVLDTFFAGSTVAVCGAEIGLPVTFGYKKVEDIKTSNLSIRNVMQPMWNTREAQQLKDSLILSEKAQKFAIAREIYWCDTYYVHLHSLMLSFSVANCYILSRLLNDRFQLLQRVPRKARVLMYGLVAAFNATAYICVKDASSQYWDKKADESAAALGREYAEGGVEYYQKTLQKNRALRELMGKAGEKTYTSKGNINRIFRTDHLPLTYRLDCLMDQVKSWGNEETKNQVLA
ncbi:hypothetical protein HPB47_000801 [Ixodes persulcatus]|uniref:Uncharacterized protein n=1 Tax=Ixodes persulcatus TaxID=34615 RepID=A0AC60PRJ9_IXOPE|nr:hypothetical protein HPB47_000801 [Ixodes persulcatus]